MEIPQELVDSVIELCSDDLVDLRALSKVSRSFSASAQRLIFANIRLHKPISEGETETVPERFLDLLQESPRIASWVKSLTIDAGDTNPSWISSDNSLVEILALVSPAKISLSFTGFFARFQWHLLPSKLIQSLSNCFRNANSIALSGVHFVNLATFAHIMQECSALTKLSLTSVTFPRDTDISEFKARPRLGSLSLRGWSYRASEVCWLLNSALLDLRHVSELAVDIKNRTDCQDVWGLLDRTRATMKRLTLWFSYDRAFAMLQVPEIAQLETIQFNMMIDSEEQLQHVIEWFTIFFHQPAPRLQEITIHLDFMFVQTAFPLNVADWTNLDSILSRGELPSIKRIFVAMDATPNMWSPIQTQEAFPSLREKGLLYLRSGRGVSRFRSWQILT
ncbi:hypothetical protein C8J56DRAFT_956031 [Mycena floridula]|nr:hypothetical protein C8J56DRAFT_956031 [Mycena floridula]